MEGGVNFLPSRRVRALRLRRRRRIQLALAACMGLLGALAIGEGQRIHDARADARSSMLNSAFKQMEPALAESHALEQALQARTRRAALISALAVARDEALHLLTALGEAPSTGIALTELRYRAGRATVSGSTSGQHALAAWVARLDRLAAFDSVEIADIQRRPAQANQTAAATTGKDVDFSVQIQFATAQAGARTRAASAAAVGLPSAPGRKTP
jgi:Tfp pilus assembly protein PilN